MSMLPQHPYRWIDLKERLSLSKIDDTLLSNQPCEKQHRICFRIDMRDGKSFVTQESTSRDPQPLALFMLTDLKLCAESRKRFDDIYGLATSLMNGDNDPWLWFYHPEFKYLNVYLDPARGRITGIVDNFGQGVGKRELDYRKLK